MGVLFWWSLYEGSYYFGSILGGPDSWKLPYGSLPNLRVLLGVPIERIIAYLGGSYGGFYKSGGPSKGEPRPPIKGLGVPAGLI